MSRIHRVEPRKHTSLPEIGKLKCGYKAKNQDGKEYPKSVDYFIPVDKYDGAYAKQFTEIYGPEPRNVPIVFFSDNMDEICREFYELRDSAGKLVAKGDGIDFTVWSTKEDPAGKWIDISLIERPTFMVDALRLPKCEKSQWTENVEMYFLLPGMRRIFGCWCFRSRGSKSTIPHIIGTIDMFKERAGRVSMIPFDLQVKFATGQEPGSKKRYPVVSIVPNISPENVFILKQFAPTIQDVSGLITDQTVDEIKKRSEELEVKTGEIEVQEDDPETEIDPKNPLGIQ